MTSENKAARDVVETVESMLKEWGDEYERVGKRGAVDFVPKAVDFVPPDAKLRDRTIPLALPRRYDK